MDPSKFFVLLRFILSLTLVYSNKINIRNQANIIKNVCQFYKSTSMTIIHFTNYQNILEMNVVFNIARTLSNEKMMTSIIAFEEMTPLKSYNKLRDLKQSVKPLNVMLITSRNSTLKIKDLTKYFPLHESINLLLFIEVNENPLIDFCMFPVGNPFKFRFDTLILVKCYEDNIIREWHLESRNQMHFFDWAIWNPTLGLIVKTNDSIMERRDLYGRVLRIATVKESYFSQWKDGHLTGFFGDILQELQHAMNFTIENVKIVDSYGRWLEHSQTWTGALGLAVRGEVDLVLSDFSLSPHRLCCIDFTEPLVTLKNCLFIKQPSRKLEGRWYGYFRPFSYEVWGAIILLLLITPILLTIMKKKVKNSDMKSKFLSDNFLNVWAIFCQQGLSDFPSLSSLGIAYVSISVLALIISSIYSASLISKIALPIVNLPFKSLEDFVKDGTYKLAVIRDSSKYDILNTSNDSTFIKMSKLFLKKNNLPLSLQDGFNMVCLRKLAFYGRETLTRENTVKINCQIAQIEAGQVDTIAMIMQKNSPYKFMINYYLNQMKTNGVMQRIKTRYVKNLPWVKPTTNKRVAFWDTALLLSILGGGIISGIIIFLAEQIVSIYINAKRNKINKTNIRNILIDTGGLSMKLKRSAQYSEQRELIINFLRRSYNPRVVQTPIRTLIKDDKD